MNQSVAITFVNNKVNNIINNQYKIFINNINNNIFLVSYISMFIVFFISLIAVVFFAKYTYINVLAINISIIIIICIFIYRPSKLCKDYIVNRICVNILFFSFLCILGLLYLVFYTNFNIDFFTT